jgi:hypothetical protein
MPILNGLSKIDVKGTERAVPLPVGGFINGPGAA